MDLEVKLSPVVSKQRENILYTRGAISFPTCAVDRANHLHAKVAVDRDNRQLYRLGRQPLTRVIIYHIGILYLGIAFYRSTASLHNTGPVERTAKQISNTRLFK